jgi:uncharacterized protein (DUF1015 family)
VTQPYDKIPDSLIKEYLSRSPYNVAQVIRNTDYQAAGNHFQSWMDSGILRQDETDTFYVYEQRFRVGGELLSRSGLIGLVSLDESRPQVKGHERVMQGPLEDRLQLIRQTESNDGLIFSLFSDPTTEIDSLMAVVRAELEPVAQVTDDYQVEHSLWTLSDPATLEAIQNRFRDFTLYIADGHHRFETAKHYRDECRQKGWRPAGGESFDKRMMALFNTESPGLRILPTHRAVKNLREFSQDRFLNQLKNFFEVTPKESSASLYAELQESDHSLGVVLGESSESFLLTEKQGTQGFMPGIKGPARGLDVNLLHSGILEPLLEIGAKELSAQSHIGYFRDHNNMVDRVRSGEYQLAFILRPTRLEQVREISDAGEKMPQKSTDFFPKLLTGMVFMKMEIDK